MTNTYASLAYSLAYERMAQNSTSSIVYVDELQTWICVRNIPGTIYKDAVGPYPFTSISCPESKETLKNFLNEHDVISLVLVTDPLNQAINADATWLMDIFDMAPVYKEHYAVNLNKIDTTEIATAFSKHHRYEVRKANKICETRLISLADYMDQWCQLYKHLVDRHQLQGIHCFSREYFEAIAKMPEFVSIASFISGQMTSCNIWLHNEGNVYNHLGASNTQGYSNNTSYAVYAHAIQHFSDCQAIDLGGAPDTVSGQRNLSFFKKGFSNQTNINRICGIIVNPKRYASLCDQFDIDPKQTTFFPAYRTTAKNI